MSHSCGVPQAPPMFLLGAVIAATECLREWQGYVMYDLGECALSFRRVCRCCCFEFQMVRLKAHKLDFALEHEEEYVSEIEDWEKEYSKVVPAVVFLPVLQKEQACTKSLHIN